MSKRRQTYIRGRSGTAGFSLVELLVTVAIIAILASLLIGGLALAKTQGRSAVCKAHLRQQGIALTMYALDYDVYPYAADFSRGAIWHKSLEPYVKESQGVFDCPEYRGAKGMAWAGNIIFYRGGSYGYNGFGSRSTEYRYVSNYDVLGLGADRGYNPNNSFAPIPAARVLKPSEMIAVGDSMMTDFKVTGYLLNIKDGQRDTPPRHVSKSNIVFADDHVESIEHRRLVAPTEAARKRWNNDFQSHLK